MVESINQTTNTKKLDYTSVSAKSVNMVNMIKSKNEAEVIMGKIEADIADLETSLDQSSGKTLTKSAHDSFLQSTNNLKQEYESMVNKNISESDYKSISDNYQKIQQLITEIKKYKTGYKTEFKNNIRGTINEMNDVINKEHENSALLEKVLTRIEQLSDKELKDQTKTKHIKSEFIRKGQNYSDELDKIKEEVIKSVESLKTQIESKAIDMETFRDEVVIIENTLQQKIDTWSEKIYDEYKQKIEQEKGSAVAEHKDDVERKKEPKKKEARKKPKEITPTAVIYTNKADFRKAFNEAAANNMKSKEQKTDSIYKRFKSATIYSMSALSGSWEKYVALSDADKQEYFKKK